MRSWAAFTLVGLSLASAKDQVPHSTVQTLARRTASSDFALRTAAVYARQGENIEIHSAYAKIENIEIHKDYGAPIGSDTSLLSVEGSTTKWIGVNTEYLTELTKTETQNGAVTTTVVKPAVAITTEGADVIVLLSEKIQNDIGSLVNDGVASCAGAAARARSMRKRDASTCLIDFFTNVAGKDDVVSGLSGAELQELGLSIIESAPQALRNIAQVVTNKVIRNKLIVILAAATTAGAFAESGIVPNVGDLVPHKLKFEGGQYGKPADGQSNDENNDQSTCKKDAPPDENSPVCEDQDCSGQDQKCTAEGKNKDCPCANYWDSFESTVDQEILDDRQKFFKEIAEMSDEPAPSGPKCDIENTDFPIDAFYSQNYNLAGKSFCPGWEEHKDSSLTMTVNEEGYQMPLLGKRTPPANLANLIDWRAQLKFDKAEGVNDCAKTCDEAFQDFRLHCGGSSSGQFMYKKGELNVDCGTFRYELFPPPKKQEPSPPAENPPQANPPPDNTNCNRDGDCEKYNCPNSNYAKATCKSGLTGDPLTMLCAC